MGIDSITCRFLQCPAGVLALICCFLSNYHQIKSTQLIHFNPSSSFFYSRPAQHAGRESFPWGPWELNFSIVENVAKPWPGISDCRSRISSILQWISTSKWNRRLWPAVNLLIIWPFEISEFADLLFRDILLAA